MRKKITTESENYRGMLFALEGSPVILPTREYELFSLLFRDLTDRSVEIIKRVNTAVTFFFTTYLKTLH